MGSVSSKSISESFGRTGSFLEYDRVLMQVKSGDLIEVQRDAYKHWVICEVVIGTTVWCFHVTTHGSNNLRDGEPVARKEIAINGKAVLKYEPLEDILKDTTSERPSLCRVNNQEIMAQKMLATVGNQSPPLSQVFELLHRLKDTLLKYDLRSNNCEHYCTLWKYGIGWSSQVNTFKEIITAGLQLTSDLTKALSDIASKNGCYRLGMVCLLVSTVTSVAEKVVNGIEFTLKDLMVDNMRHGFRQAIKY